MAIWRKHQRGTAERLAAMKKVIEACEAYAGEVIEAEKHPLWLAVVALEELSMTRDRERFPKHWRQLDLDIKADWLRGLWASRDRNMNIPISMRDKLLPMSQAKRDMFIGPSDPILAMQWIKFLRDGVAFKFAEELPR